MVHFCHSFLVIVDIVDIVDTVLFLSILDSYREKKNGYKERLI